MFSGMKTMTHWNNEYVYEDSINVRKNSAVLPALPLFRGGANAPSSSPSLGVLYLSTLSERIVSVAFRKSV